MYTAITLLPLLAIGALAESTRVQPVFFAAPQESNEYAGSVVAVGGGQTTYAVACTSGNSNCYTSTTITLTEGPSTFNVQSQTVVAGNTASISEGCMIDGTTSATCTAAISLSADGVDTESTSTTTLGTNGFHYHPITLTAGVDKLGSATGSGSDSSATATGSSGNGAAPMATGMGIAGAALVGLAALL